MYRRTRKILKFAAVLTWLALSAPLVHAGMDEEFPAQSIRIVVPFPPGGSTDSIARALADGLTRELGEMVYIDNRPGASTNIGADWVTKARADGYTLLFGGSALMVNAIFGPKPAFVPHEALQPISMVAEVPFVLVVHANAPFQTAKAFLEAAQADPGKYSIASAQLETYVEKWKLAAHINLLHVPYKGGAQAVTDVIAGQVNATFALVPVLLPQIQSGKLRALGISSSQRLASSLPDVPTFTESGIDFRTTVWYGLQAPAGIDPDRLSKLNKATRKVVAAPEFVARLADAGARASGSTPEAMGQMLEKQRLAWERLATRQPQLIQGK